MIKVLCERLRQKHRTVDFPKVHPPLSERFRGLPVVDAAKCSSGCEACVAVCPVGAVFVDRQGPIIDMGRCLFCDACAHACPNGALRFGGDFHLAARRREDLLVRGIGQPPLAPLENARQKLFRRSLKLRQVSAGGCNACEADINVLGTLVFDLGRFGIEFTASPRHADGVVVTGPVTRNMRDALLWTYDATPDPKVVVAVGACAIAGGPFAGFPETNDGVGDLLPVDLYIPGCPPHPLTILDGLLRLVSAKYAVGMEG